MRIERAPPSCALVRRRCLARRCRGGDLRRGFGGRGRRGMISAMLKPLSVAFALAVAVLASRKASATALFFSSPGPGDVPGLVQVDMWFEDASRKKDLVALQFDVDVVGNSPLAPSVVLPNTARDDGTGTNPWPDYGGEGFPFDVFQSITDPPGPAPTDIRMIGASNFLLDIEYIAAMVAAYPNCVGDACQLQKIGLENARLYLGSFNLAYDAQ